MATIKSNIVDSIIVRLGDNYHENDRAVLEDAYDDYMIIAMNESNRRKDDKSLIPIVKKAVVSMYERRGNEGSSSSSEGGLSNSYNDIEEKLKKDCRSIRRIA